MKFDNYTTVYFVGEGSHARVERTKDIIRTILQIFYGKKYDGLSWIVTKFSIGNEHYDVNFIYNENELSIKILKHQDDA